MSRKVDNGGLTPLMLCTLTSTTTPTASPTPSQTLTPTLTFTITATGSPTNTTSPTPTPQPPPVDIFYVDQNVYHPSQGPVSIYVGYSLAGTPFSLKVYNSAGEFIRDLSGEKHIYSSPITPEDNPFSWDGKNMDGDLCASGVYILYLTEPYDRKFKRLILIR